MRVSSALSSAALLFSGLASARGFDCKDIVVDKYKYNLNPLGGVHVLYDNNVTESSSVNTTYVLNICGILKGASNRDGMKCGTSKNICGFEKTHFPDGAETKKPFPIAGLEPGGHGSMEPQITRLKSDDSDREGLRVKLSGGSYENADGKKKKAGAVIEFQCDPDRSGLEGLESTKDEEMRRREEAGDAQDQQSLQFKSFGLADDDSYVLRLDWKTRYACDNYVDDKEGDSSSHWGFFTWLIIILFLVIAAYLIFGSWLNYNRYGARGWDLLPHGDTLRDVPYIFQDWLRRVINTLQGSGSRGGYSAV
ncbi:putative autophagy protein Atg27 [Aspergillus steynii IBT 23096]|uniref:Autophagy-related protein 27 n=1 Tax=Aspergillus steynii IBT 23096 TaxID=1392250 RepID=A0A2I2G5U4_9EURO|nr:putative autophagy protein Atg27 [Aspergillus steynii IBT 23096]PLB48239.1 putative autophagy protein Atg27 [Aspergillus steynii IBT 23096]